MERHGEQQRRDDCRRDKPVRQSQQDAEGAIDAPFVNISWQSP